MKLWLVQLDIKVRNKVRNLENILSFVGKAGEAKADLVVFPELALSGYTCHQEFYHLGEPLSGPSVKEIEKAARETHLHVILGMPEVKDVYLYNSAVLIGPEGVKGVWRKLTLATGWTPTVTYDEGLYFKPGKEITTFETSFGKIGIEICRDCWSPEIDRVHAARGALLLICISAAPAGVPEYFHVLGKARAAENTSWWAYVNQVGIQDGVQFTGGTCVINPYLKTCKQCSMGTEAQEEVLEFELDMDRFRETRLRDLFVRDTRADTLRQSANIIEQLV